MVVGLIVVLVLVLVLPLGVKIVENNLEIFLFIMGVLAALISQALNVDLLVSIAQNEFIYMITAAVLVAGFVFKYVKHHVRRGVGVLVQKIHTPLFIFLLIVVLGFLSSLVTAIIAALLLVEVVRVMPLTRQAKVRLTIVACFSIGLGAVLTPVGEPLATVVTSRLHGGFWYLASLLSGDILVGIVLLGVFGAVLCGRGGAKIEVDLVGESPDESVKDIVVRAAKILLFVIALELLGAGFKPMIDNYVIQLDSQILFWINMVSAILDNATLASAEISAAMSVAQIRAILLGLLISGGMLIPGNIPNIISAHQLKISSRDWAKLGVPVGLVLMAGFFVVLFVV